MPSPRRRPPIPPAVAGPRGPVRGLSVLLALALASVPVAMPALAYVDPAASSLILQVVLGGIAGLGVLLRLFWGRIRRWVRREPSPAADENSGAGSSR